MRKQRAKKVKYHTRDFILVRGGYLNLWSPLIPTPVSELLPELEIFSTIKNSFIVGGEAFTNIYLEV